MNFFTQLYTSIQEYIKTEIPEINWIEQDFGQDAYDSFRPSVSFPALLIDFPASDYSQLSGLDQMASVVIKMRLLVAPFEQSYEGAPITVITRALDYFELEQKIINALHGWAPTYDDSGTTKILCSGLIRSSIRSSNRNDIGLRIRELTFTTSYEEYIE